MKYKVMAFCFLLTHAAHAEQWVGIPNPPPETSQAPIYRMSKPKKDIVWLLSFATVSATALIVAGTYRVKADWDLQNARKLRDISDNLQNNGMFFIDASEYITQARTLENRADRKKRLAKVCDAIGIASLTMTLIELRF